MRKKVVFIIVLFTLLALLVFFIYLLWVYYLKPKNEITNNSIKEKNINNIVNVDDNGILYNYIKGIFKNVYEIGLYVETKNKYNLDNNQNTIVSIRDINKQNNNFLIYVDNTKCIEDNLSKFLCFTTKINTGVVISVVNNDKSVNYFINSPTKNTSLTTTNTSINANKSVLVENISEFQNITLNIKSGAYILRQYVIDLYGNKETPLIKSINIQNEKYNIVYNVDVNTNKKNINVLKGINTLTFETYINEENINIHANTKFIQSNNKYIFDINENTVTNIKISSNTKEFNIVLIPSYFVVLPYDEVKKMPVEILPYAKLNDKYNALIKVYTYIPGPYNYNLLSPLPNSFIGYTTNDNEYYIKSDNAIDQGVFKLNINTITGELIYGSGPIQFDIKTFKDIKINTTIFNNNSNSNYYFPTGSEITLMEIDKDNNIIGRYSDTIDNCNLGLCKILINKPIKEVLFKNNNIDKNIKRKIEIYIPTLGSKVFNLNEN